MKETKNHRKGKTNDKLNLFLVQLKQWKKAKADR